MVKFKYLDIVKNVDETKEEDIYLYDLIDSYLEALKSDDDNSACVLYLLYSFHFQKKLENVAVNSRSKEILYYKPLRAIERGTKKGYFYDSNPEDMGRVMFACISALCYKRILVGQEKFKCPSANIIMRVVLKNKEEAQNV